MLKIVSAPDKGLNAVSVPVEKIDQKIYKLVMDMEKTLVSQEDPQGVGLAAPQVGVGIQLFIVKPRPHLKTEVFINPKILELEGTASYKNRSKKAREAAKDEESALEGCLSIHRIWAPVKRANKVRLEYLDLEGKKHTRWFSGFRSVIVQHEVDHLKGILFTQRATEQGARLYEEKNGKLKKLEV